MMHVYLDSSALVKRYVAETGTAWVERLCAPASGHTLYTVRVSGAEIVATFFLRMRRGSISSPDADRAVARFQDDFRSQYQIIEVTEGLVDLAMTLAGGYPLRGYDAIQLAAALTLHEMRASLSLAPLTFVCADSRLNRAAAAAGLLAVEDPNDH